MWVPPVTSAFTLPQDDFGVVVQFFPGSLNIARVGDTLSHMHVRVTSMIQCCLVAHFGYNVCLVMRGSHFATSVSVLLVSLSSMDWTLSSAPQYEFMLRSSRHTRVEGRFEVVTQYILVVTRIS